MTPTRGEFEAKLAAVSARKMSVVDRLMIDHISWLADGMSDARRSYSFDDLEEIEKRSSNLETNDDD